MWKAGRHQSDTMTEFGMRTLTSVVESGQASVRYNKRKLPASNELVVESGQASVRYNLAQGIPPQVVVVESGQASVRYNKRW